FGMSVDGAGDYNGDGHADVVVGAPAGVDLGSLSALLTGQLLQGSALVYYGTGSGIDVQPDVTLAATAGGLLTNFTGTIANVANLFGFALKGATNAAGVRTGNILVGAPLGGTLTNLLSGLNVKTGTVSVFKKNASPSGIVTPDQQLTSPRNDNTILNLIQSSLLFGFSMDNVEDVNCDGIGDIVIGEPATLSAQIVGANVAGGAAYVFLGKSDGTYQATPAWTVNATYDAALGVNVTSLIGYSVAGAKKVKGGLTQNKILVGAPGKTLDFGTGLLNLGNTLGTLFGLAAGDNGVGKAYEFDTQLCGSGSLPLQITHFSAALQTTQDVLVNWSVNSEKEVNYYLIERSADAKSWETLTSVAATHLTDIEKNYSYTDENPYTGISYYRLQQADLSGVIFYSEIQEINNDAAFAAGVKVTNPFYNMFTVRLNSLHQNSGMMELMDINGKSIARQNITVGIGVNSYQVNSLSALARGIYILHIINGNDNYTTKLVKE
ncbi:MAG TPA: T9SS type A sorting domain-containing protein, partial [Puia sp.]|nr:T9SS type A sorting domain-containing protein [Puia sp.]